MAYDAIAIIINHLVLLVFSLTKLIFVYFFVVVLYNLGEHSNAGNGSFFYLKLQFSIQTCLVR